MPRSTTRERVEAAARRRLDDRQNRVGTPLRSCQNTDAPPTGKSGSAGRRPAQTRAGASLSRDRGCVPAARRPPLPTTGGRGPRPAAVPRLGSGSSYSSPSSSSSGVSGPYSCLMISSAWSGRRSAVPPWPGIPRPAGRRRPAPRPAHRPAGQCAPERGEVGIQVLDLLIPRRPEPGPQELAPPRQLVVRLHAHAASLSGRWPLPDAVTWVTSWLTLRRDRPNRSAMARWLNGCPAATDAA